MIMQVVPLLAAAAAASAAASNPLRAMYHLSDIDQDGALSAADFEGVSSVVKDFVFKRLDVDSDGTILLSLPSTASLCHQ
jgi:hypothetical protein